METEEYKVKTEVFEGPMALLIHLLERNKVDIYDIPIAKITAQYLQYIEEMHKFDMDVASEFVVMASLLLHIKARMLLPQLHPAEDEDNTDPRELLVEKIIEYKKFQKSARIFDKILQIENSFVKRSSSPINLKEAVLQNYDSKLLYEVMKKLFERINEEELVRYVDVEELNVQEIMDKIAGKLQSSHRKQPFFSLFDSIPKLNMELIVVSFLALLELIKQGKILVSQEDRFLPIYVEWVSK